MHLQETKVDSDNSSQTWVIQYLSIDVDALSDLKLKTIRQCALCRAANEGMNERDW